MKRYIIFAITLILALLTLSVTGLALVYAPGDVNYDMAIDLMDVTSLRQYLAGGYGVTVMQSTLDVNKDGTVDLKDVTYLRRGLAGGYGIELEAPLTYEFAVLEKVESLDEGYYATLITNESGTAVTNKVLLDDSVGEELYAKGIAHEVVSYAKSGDIYDVIVGQAPTDNYIRVPAGVIFKYKYITGLYQIGDYTKVLMPASAEIYYKYTVGANEGLTYVDVYTRADLPNDRTYEMQTAGDTYLTYDESRRAYILAATLLDGKIVEAYNFDNGTPVLYAPEPSFCVLVGDKIYNSYVFMNNSTIMNDDPVTNRALEYHSVYNPGTTKGGLYIYNNSTLVYEEVTCDGWHEYVEGGDIADIIMEDRLIECADNSFWQVTEGTAIWGLKDANRNDTYKVMTLEDLNEMFELVEAHNSSEGDDLAVRLLFLKDEGEEYWRPLSIIVEIFKKDGNGKVYSVNDTIFRGYYKE